MGFRGSESLGRGSSAYLLRRFRRTVQRFPGLPFLSARLASPTLRWLRLSRCRLWRSSRELVRPSRVPVEDSPSAHRANVGQSVSRAYRPFEGGRQPSWAFTSLQRLRNRGSADRGVALPPRSGLSVFRALAGFRPPKPVRAYFVPVTLLGFHDLQGLCPLEELVPSRGLHPLLPFTA